MHSYGFVIVPTLEDAKLNAASLEDHIAARLAPFYEHSRYGFKSGKFDFYEIGGRWSGLIEGSRCSVDEFLSTSDKPLPFMILTLDGEWFEMLDESALAEWWPRAIGILEAHRGMYIVTIDYHS